MAAVSLLGTPTFNTTAGAKTVTATPAVGDLIVILAAFSNATDMNDPSDDQGGTYSWLGFTVRSASGLILGAFVRNSLVTSATSTVYSVDTNDADNGGGLAVLKVTGCPVAGADAIRQIAVADDKNSGTTPTPVFSNTTLVGNPIIGAVLNLNNPPGLTPRTGYSERYDSGYSTPTTGMEVMSSDVGEAVTSVAWGGTSGSNYCALAIELNARVAKLGDTINTTAGAKTVTATPAVGDLIVIVQFQADDTTWSAPSDNKSGTYSLIVGHTASWNTGSGCKAYVRDALISDASPTIFSSSNPGSDTGGGIAVLKVTGMSKYGTNAIRQSKGNRTTTSVVPTATFDSAPLTTNVVINAVCTASAETINHKTGYTELLDSGFVTPPFDYQIQSIESGETSTSVAWGAGTTTSDDYGIIAFELDTSASLVTEELTAATFGFTSNSLTTKKTTNLGAASFGFATLNGQLSRTGQLYAGSLDFTNQPWQQHATNNQGAAALNFTAQNAEPTQVVTLSDAALSMSATDITFARQNNLGVVSFDLVENVVYAGSRVDLDATQLKFAENDVVLGRTISLAAAALDMAPYGVAPTAVITLNTATVDNTALDITPSNAPLGTVVDLDTAALGFVVYDVSAGSEINLSLALLSFAMENQQNAAEVKLSAAALNFTAQDIGAVKDPVVIELTAAAFDFTEYALQAAGVPSIGDRRRILMGVGR